MFTSSQSKFRCRQEYPFQLSFVRRCSWHFGQVFGLSVSQLNYRFCAASKGKTNGSTRPFCIPTDCVFAQPCYCSHCLCSLACPLSPQLQATDLPLCLGLMLLYCMSLVIFCVHVLSSRRPPASNSDITFCS